MEKCLHSRRSRMENNISFIGLACESIFFMLLASFMLITQPIDSALLSGCICLLLAGFGLLAFGTFSYIVLSREYTLDSKGITIYYMKKYSVRYLWVDVTDIGFCDVNHASADRDRYDTVIRMVWGTEKKGPKSEAPPVALTGYEKWRGSGYGLFHFRTIIILEYSKTRYDKILELSGREIEDYRTERVKKGQ